MEQQLHPENRVSYSDNKHMLAFQAKAKQVWQTAYDKAVRHSKGVGEGLHFHCEDFSLVVASEHLWTMRCHLADASGVSPRDVDYETLVDLFDEALADQLRPLGLGSFIKESRGVHTMHFQLKV